MNMEDFCLKQCYDADLTISRSQYGGFSTSGLMLSPDCSMYMLLSDDKHQMVRDSSKTALASVDAIVTQLLCYNMPLLYFICKHLIV